MVVEFVLPRESVAVTVIDLAPALNTPEVYGEPVPDIAPDMV